MASTSRVWGWSSEFRVGLGALQKRKLLRFHKDCLNLHLSTVKAS